MVKYAFLIPSALLLLALFPMPYGYYTFLRLAVTIAAALIVWLEYKKRDQINQWSIGFCLIAILFNPLIPIFLTRDIWFILDIAVSLIFAAYSFLQRDNK